MFRSSVLRVLLILLLSTPVHADTLRLKLRPSSGELTTTQKPCGQDVVANVWKLVHRAPYVEIVGETMLAAVGEKKREADRVAPGEPFVGFYDQTPEKTIAITVRRAASRRGLVPVYLAIVVRSGAGTCSEQWLGLGEVL